MADKRFHTVVACNAINACVASQITKLRNSLGVTQAVLAEYLEEHPNQTQRRETGRHDIGVTDLYAISAYFDVPLEYFVEPLRAVSLKEA